jgi:8-oxo-dGTP pyrophosphatase MutT (NUDIX family)
MQRRVPKFDPQMVPIQEPYINAPPVSIDVLQPDALRRRFEESKPWTPELTDESRQSIEYIQGGGKRIAAVLIPIVQKDDHLSVLLTKRAEHLNDHAGQISFPGGRKEDSDIDLKHTALREAHEEIGLHHHHVEYLGHLPDYFTITGYQVTPIVGLVSSVEELVPDTNEVAEIFEVPLSFLMNPANHQVREWVGPDGRRRFYAMPYESKFIWGATAGMLRNLYHFLRA